jgi:hypothetical protein
MRGVLQADIYPRCKTSSVSTSSIQVKVSEEGRVCQVGKSQNGASKRSEQDSGDNWMDRNRGEVSR